MHGLRTTALVLLLAAACPAPAASPEPAFVQAVEFPYYLYPRALWERELVWLKTIGIRTVEFSIPWNWHQLQPNDFDFNGRTSPRRDLVGLVRILRRLDLQAWVRPLPPVEGWLAEGTPAFPQDAGAQRTWLRQLEGILGTQTSSHGGPVAYVEGRALAIDAAVPPSPVATISAGDPEAFALSRKAIAGAKGALLWTGVEDALYPAGWQGDPGIFLRKGAVGLSGDERPATRILRRNSALLRNWAPLLGALQPVPLPKPPAGKLPDGITAMEAASAVASAVSITNRSGKLFSDELRVLDPASKRVLVIPGVTVAAGESLWLPVSVSLGPEGLCRECTNFSAAEHIVYATAELLSVEVDNGILAMEFAAPAAAEAILQFARQPVGPFLAAGKPTEFDWDDKTLRARLKIPAGNAPGNRVRIGIAIEAPETSAFFNEPRRLVIGQKNLVSTLYSSADVAKRSRLRLPEGFTATSREKSPNEIDYEVTVPPDAIHGDWVNLALEADGLPLGRARLQLFRPVSIRAGQALQIHFGSHSELTPEPNIVPVEPKAGTNLEIVVRNNYPGISTFHLQASGEGLEFFPPKTDLNVGATDERTVSLRVFATDGAAGLRDLRLKVTGAATLDIPMRVLLLPRGRTVAWSADLDGDGSPEWVLESQKVRAVFSSRNGGRWMEFTWKDANANFLPEAGIWGTNDAVNVRATADDALEFTAKGWKRSIGLKDNVLTVEQSPEAPPDGLGAEKRGNVTLAIDRPAPSKLVFSLK
jgi:hypothetical protein